MCGIVGMVVRLPFALQQGKVLRAMANSIAHRGPDDEGYFEAATHDGRYAIGLGHRRLSIIDLSTGHQPIGNEDGSVQIVFNGEIYNFAELRKDLLERGHRFSTTSDTETIVHAYEEYGEECVQKFRGMFAFAIWDANRDKLFLARDRYGKKPLFVQLEDNGLRFASEIKALLQWPGCSRHVNYQAVTEYLAYRYVPVPDTLFDGIEKLPPGTIAVWEKGKYRQRSYYCPPDGEPYEAQNNELREPVSHFLELLDESVRVRMVSDVPFGAFLSGGIDSSAIVGLMSRHSSTPINTFSVGFKESQYSELSYAKVIAEQFGTEHHELAVSEQQLMDELPKLVRFRDAPVSEPSDIPIYLLSREARRTVKMVLTGEGSDEFLGGYPKHVFERWVSSYQRLPHAMRHGLIEPLISALPYRFRRAKTAIVNMGLEKWLERMPRWFGALSPTERTRLLAVCESKPGLHKQLQCQAVSEASPLRKILFFDQTSWLPDNLLERGDRMTMAASLEARMPFVDHELAAFVSSLPDNYRVRGLTTKWILRQAMQRMLPKSILVRPKVGFRVPVNEWFRGPMRDYLHDHLLGSDSLTRIYYHRAELERVLAEHVDGRQNHEKLLWCLLNLELWHREYRPGI